MKSLSAVVLVLTSARAGVVRQAAEMHEWLPVDDGRMQHAAEMHEWLPVDDGRMQHAVANAVGNAVGQTQCRETGEDMYEGDIILRPDQDERNLVLPAKIWPNGELPYSFDSGFTDEEKRKIERALQALQQETCVRFVRRSNQNNYINIKNSGLGCASEVGYFNKGYPTDLHLTTPSCLAKPGTIQHEFLHALGFWHEHTRPDRDKYIKIVWKNVVKGKEDNFFARPADEIQTLGSPYDYGSVMHYPSTAFSRDGLSATIIPSDDNALFSIGQRDKYSKADLAKLNRLYKCSGYYQGF